MRCGRPKWMLRQLFQVFFLTILSVLIIGAVLAYLLYFLPANNNNSSGGGGTSVGRGGGSGGRYPPLSASNNAYHPQYHQYQSGSSSSNAESRSSYPSAIIANKPEDAFDKASLSLSGQGQQHWQRLIALESAPIRHVSTVVSQSPGQKNSVSRAAAGASSSWREFGGEYREKCSMFTCFDIHRCGVDNGSLSIYIYPIYQWFVDGQRVQTGLSREFYQFLRALRRSPYYVEDPSKACLFVPSIDLLNLNRVRASSKELLAVLSSLEYWGKSGQNHLLFTLFPGNSPLLQLQTNAIIASSGLFMEHYRLGFHVPVISPSPLVFFNGNLSYSSAPSTSSQLTSNFFSSHEWIAVAILQGHYSFDDLSVILSSPGDEGNQNQVLVLDYCSHSPKNYSVRCSISSSGGGSHRSASPSEEYPYPDVLRRFDFCLVLRDLASPVLWEVMSQGCIPVIIADHQRLPFDEVLDWRQMAIPVYQHQISQLSSILGGVTPKRRERLKAQVQFAFRRYFSDMERITGSLVEVVKDRVFSHFGRTRQEWGQGEQRVFSLSPFFNPVTAAKEGGFTAVILAYERVQSLFTVIQRLAQVPSLAKVLVIWNNQIKEPPALDSWPKVGIPVKIIKTTANKLSNRFFPHDEIETEAVFSLDDDIVMLTTDEMEFAFETWREFPDRLVGFPSRSHVWDNGTRRWKYESEWTSEISMVLTGAAFYHKYWHYAYTNELSRDIRDWVDAKMNCEDIAMNFLVAARTGKPPIKVTPRKKFKCPTCNNNEMLSSDTSHMVERTECINRFTQLMGFMPLIPTEFRADPVLLKVDGVPNRLKWYSDMGTM